MEKALSKKFINKLCNNTNPYFKKNTIKIMINLMKKINFDKETQKNFMRKKIKIVFIGSVLFSKHLLEMFNKLGLNIQKLSN